MIGNFDSFLSENSRQTKSGKIYPKFGQVFVELGLAPTEFSKDKGVETSIAMMREANELNATLRNKLVEDVSIDSDNFDMNLSENVSAVNMLMENEFLSVKPTDLAQLKSMILCSEARRPSLVIKGGELNDIVTEATKLGYSKRDIHVVFNMNEMKVEFADTEKLVIERMTFDKNTATETLAMASTLNLGDVYITSESVQSKAELVGVNEIKIKSGSRGMTLGALNRHVMSCLVVAESAESSFVPSGRADTGLPMLEGFKAYELKPNVTMIEHAQNAFSKDIVDAPLNSVAWEKLQAVNEVYFGNGWKLKHDSRNLVLTEAVNAMRAGRECQEYRIELSEAGYPLLDLIAMMERSESTRWSCEALAEAILNFDGCVTPERQVIKAYNTVVESNRVFHPRIMSELRPVTEAVNDVDSLIRAVANDQFKSFKIGQSFAETMLDKETIYSMMNHIVENGIDVNVDGDMVEFKVNATNYNIIFDIK
ncbi:hypothetical protein VPHF86_0094 [Vibrio phage F86]